MDLEEWEILPEDGYLDIQYDAGKKIFSRKYGDDDSNNLYKNNYFICPSQELLESTENSSSRVPKQPLHVPIQLSTFHDEQVVKGVINMEPINNSSSASLEKIKDVLDSGSPLEADHDPVSQVFFKKMVENKSVDMKMDSPKSNNKGLIPQMDPATIRFDNEANPTKEEALESKNSMQKPENEKIKEISDEVTWGQDSGGLNIWKLSLNRFGAICSFGVVAASICIIILGGRKQNKRPHQQNQKVPFHIFTEDKRIKQVVHHATRLNEAISTMRGVQGVRAHITVGGYYEGL
ncbi:hypothetical protein LIER_41224 [Lithospermum erythrorhizon]|uniref:DUF6821 domain-containing protein n=1 Tax=Lithospermum erythrorhizon TaxID=34254 RepID=A0AAV3R9Z6_LITER